MVPEASALERWEAEMAQIYSYVLCYCHGTWDMLCFWTWRCFPCVCTSAGLFSLLYLPALTVTLAQGFPSLFRCCLLQHGSVQGWRLLGQPCMAGGGAPGIGHGLLTAELLARSPQVAPAAFLRLGPWETSLTLTWWNRQWWIVNILCI